MIVLNKQIYKRKWLYNTYMNKAFSYILELTLKRLSENTSLLLNIDYGIFYDAT